MTKILFIPLDERPCNVRYPVRTAAESGIVDLLIPPQSMLGRKKEPADTERIWNWVEEHADSCSHLVASIDMLVYGGIVPSRLHDMSREQCLNAVERLKALKSRHSSIKIYAFNLIMRVPEYSSSDEEPDYYGTYGKSIFRYSWLSDRKRQGLAGAEELQELEALGIPEEYLKDYTERRAVNHFINSTMVELAEQGVLDFLVIPLDDCSQYGFSATERSRLMKKIYQAGIMDKVFLYPGADEVGCVLVSRAVSDVAGTRPAVYVRYSSLEGPFRIPRYEDRKLGESIKYQITAAGGVLADNSRDADFILMVSSPDGRRDLMDEAFDEGGSEEADPASRNLPEFVSSLEHYTKSGKKCALADVAEGNGAEPQLMDMLYRRGLLNKLLAFAAWNTSGNTLGTVISHAMVTCRREQACGGSYLYERLVEDWAYMSVIRNQLFGQYPMQLGGKEADAGKDAVRLLNAFLAERDYLGFARQEAEVVEFPWKRLFEIDFRLKGAESL